MKNWAKVLKNTSPKKTWIRCLLQVPFEARDQTCNQVSTLDQESNSEPCGVGADALTIEKHRPGPKKIIDSKKAYEKMFHILCHWGIQTKTTVSYHRIFFRMAKI